MALFAGRPAEGPAGRVRVNAERLYERLREAGGIGLKEDGVHCLALTPEDEQVIELLAGYMKEAGLSVRRDAAGDLIGRKEGRDSALPVIMTGSHSDTVRGGGIFDGRLGVIGGIEALQTMNELGIVTDRPLEVWVYRDEEGNRFARGYSSARFLAGTPRRGIFEMRDSEGVSMREALVFCGIDPERAEEARLPRNYAAAHLELHIEQGAVLERAGLPLGAVSGIFCQVRGSCTVTGAASHAGTTPMDMRRDASCAAAELALAAERTAAGRKDCVATAGCWEVSPGAVNVIPGRARLSFDVRAMEPSDVAEMIEEIKRSGAAIAERRGVSVAFELDPPERKDAKLFDPRVTEAIEKSLEELGLPVFSLPSGAGHDSGNFCGLFPCGMIFVRTKDGISHNAAEYASKEDCALGAEALMRTMIRLGAERGA